MKSASLPFGIAVGALAALAVAHPADAAQLRPLSAAAAASVPVAFDVKLPLRNGAELDSLLAAQSNPKSPMYRHFLTPAQFRAEFAPTAASMAKAAASLRSQGFAISGSGSQYLRAAGTAAGFARTFNAPLGLLHDRTGAFRVAAAAKPHLPAALASVGATLIGVNAVRRPQPEFRRVPTMPDNRYREAGDYWFDDLKQAYSYPANSVANGKGVTIATVGLGDFSSADATQYFAHEKVGPGGLAPAPTIEHLVFPGGPAFDPTSDLSLEANLDVQQAGGSAIGATIVGVTGNPNSADDPFYDAFGYLVDANAVDIISTSYGACELYYTAPYNDGVDETSDLVAYHDLFRQGNAQGITFLFASGDESGKGCYPAAYFGPPTGAKYPAEPGVGYWVDDPNATGVGGTNLLTTPPATNEPGTTPNVPPLPSKYVSENEIGDPVVSPLDPYGTGNFITGAIFGSGDGQSVLFAKPAFQLATSIGTGRTAPDVSMHMGGCPFYGPGIVVNCGPDNGFNTNSSDIAVLGGQITELIGTSASSPEFAGALAVIESDGIGRLGNVNPLLYQLSAFNVISNDYHQGIPAYNGLVTIPRGFIGYSTVVGVGTPIVSNVIRSLGKPVAAVAGNPQTPSNP